MEDPLTLPGVGRPGQDPNVHPPATTDELERQIAEEAGDAGIIYVTDSSDLPR